MKRHFGPSLEDDGTTSFRVWAPSCGALELAIDEGQVVPMEAVGDGFFECRTMAPVDTSYSFRLENGREVPDPASRFQPRGVHGPSMIVDLPEKAVPKTLWKGVSKEDLILYELHVGTFTFGGTYEAAIGKLDHLSELGVTAIELMPLAQAAGHWNWGYDGVNLFAPAHDYGTPEQLVELIDAAHDLGIAVILDVVYNHLGPEGNYLHPLGGYVSKTHRTPWGDAPDFDGSGAEVVRDFILENVRYWIEDFGFDGLRLDAAHCINDRSDPHIAAEIGRLFRDLEKRLERTVHLIAESNVYDSELLIPTAAGGYGFDGLWCDDFLHSVHALLAPGQHMSDRVYETGSDIDLILKRGYVFHGTLRTARERHLLEKYPDRVGMESIVAAIQNHDFIGNHPAGLRLHQAVSPEAHEAAAALLFLLPSIPMLFMGEEFQCDSPFYFFADFEDSGIREGIEKGRRAEHPQHDWESAVSPLSPEAFEHSKLTPVSDGNAGTLDWYQELIGLRKQWRGEGALSSSRMEAEWIAELSLAVIRFETDSGGKKFALIRLGAVEEGADLLSVKVTGKVEATRNFNAGNADHTIYEMGANSVLTGTGEVTFG